jgi:hypothetical protein
MTEKRLNELIIISTEELYLEEKVRYPLINKRKLIELIKNEGVLDGTCESCKYSINGWNRVGEGACKNCYIEKGLVNNWEAE